MAVNIPRGWVLQDLSDALKVVSATSGKDLFMIPKADKTFMIQGISVQNDFVDLTSFGKDLTWEKLSDNISRTGVVDLSVDLREFGGGVITLQSLDFSTIRFSMNDLDSIKDMFLLGPGTHGEDNLTGTSGEDYLRGHSGDDVIRGGAGDDELRGDHGDDEMYGGAGDDTMYGGEGYDRLQGGAGDDRLEGNASNDNLRGNDGDDQLFGGDGRDVIDGGRDDDVIVGGKGKDQLWGGEGVDRFVVHPGDGYDTIHDFYRQDGDKIDLSAFASISGFSDLEISGSASSAKIKLPGGGTIELSNCNVSTLDESDFTFAGDPDAYYGG